MKTYIVTNEGGANLRLHPSGSYPTAEPVAHLNYMDEVEVIPDWTAENTVGSSTVYLPVLWRGSVRYVAEKLVGTMPRMERTAKAAEYVYNAIYDGSVKHANGNGTTLESILKARKTDCIGAATACMVFAGLVDAGNRVGHTASDGRDGKTKTTPEKAIKGLSNLKSGTFSIVRANKIFSKLSAEHKKAGMIYVQDSNICVSAGGGKIYSCNQTGKTYGKGGEAVLRTSGYPFNRPILYIIVPKG